jgi:hypothetical protein
MMNLDGNDTALGFIDPRRLVAAAQRNAFEVFVSPH